MLLASLETDCSLEDKCAVECQQSFPGSSSGTSGWQSVCNQRGHQDLEEIGTGVIWEVLKIDGTVPADNDRLTTRVMRGNISSRQALTSQVGAGSRRQDLDGLCLMTFLTSSSYTGWNSENLACDRIPAEASSDMGWPPLSLFTMFWTLL